MFVIKVVEGILDVIIAMAIIIALVMVGAWLLHLNSMSQVDQIAFNLDKAINGQGVALFRNFENFVGVYVEMVKSMF